VAFELRQLRAFVAVGEQLSFAQAARRLNIAQPALSRTVKAIEDAVGASLLTRTTRRVQLTKAGEVFLDEARRTLLQADRTIRLARDAAEGVRGQLDIGYMDFAVHGPLMTALDSLKLEYPSLRVSLKRHRSEEQSVLVDRQQLDLGITMQHAFTPNLEIIPLTREPLRIVLPQDHPLAKWPAIPLARLAEENFVLGEPSIWRLYLRVLNDYCSRERFLPRVVCEAFESPTMFRFVARGFGLTIYPSVVETLSIPGVVVRPFAEETPILATYAVARRGERSSLIKRLVQLIREHAAVIGE
jgi:DNA-binding transcriptional LysR family regulator